MNEDDKKEVVRTLVITDGIFANQCDDSKAYLVRLKEVFAKNTHQVTEFLSIAGSHGISDIDDSFPELEVDMRNKTVFMQSLQNIIDKFDAMLIIRNVEDAYISGARQMMTENSKRLYTYGYVRKEK